eukprot:scaffold4597_cov129-Skeletonema_dohrnii-CCMP3373.AAC.3
MAEATNKSRHRKRGGRARGQMAGGMLASLSAVSDKPKLPTTASQHAAHGTSSSLMNLKNKESSSNNVDHARTMIPNNKAPVGQKRVPLKEATMNRVVERQDVKLKAKILSTRPRSTEQQVKRNAATDRNSLIMAPAPAPTTDILTTPRNNNPDVVMSPPSILSSVADDDTTLTPPPLTSVKMKHHQLETTLLSPISFVGLSLSTPSPAKMEVTAIDNNKVLDHNDDEDDEESYVQSKNGSSEESLEHSISSHEKDDATMSNESTTNKSQAVGSNSSSNSTTITNEEIATNPRIVINRKIAKDFYGKTFIGTVVGYDDGEYPAFWQVEYLDGDREDFSYAELMSGMDYYEELERDGNIPSSMDDCDVNSSYEQSLCDDYDDDDDANENDEVCFDEEETDDDEDYSIEQESDSEDELEIDEGVDSDIKNGKSRGKKGSKARSKLTTKNQVKSDTVSEGQHSDEQSSEGEMICSLDECRIDLSAQIDNDNDEIGGDGAGDVEVVVESSLDDDTDSSDETKDSDPVAVEVQSEDEEMVDNDGFEDDVVVADYDVTGITSESDAPIEVKESIAVVETEVQVEDKITAAKESESAPIKMQEERSVVDATSEQQELNTISEEANIDAGSVEEAVIEQEYSKIEVEGTGEQDFTEEATIEPQEPTTLELFAVVDRIFLESDADTVTVKDVKNSVALHFGLQKVQKEMKQAIKSRLIDLIQGNVQPIRAMKEATTDGDDVRDCDRDDQDGTVAAEAESSGGPQNGYDEASLTGEASFSCDASYVTSNSQADSFSSNASVSFGENVGDSMAMTGTLFSNLSPEYSIHSRTADDGNGSNVNDFMKMNSVSSPVIAAKPKSRSAVVKGKWSLGPEIGVGSFGRVHTGLNAVNGSKFVSGSKLLMLASFSN